MISSTDKKLSTYLDDQTSLGTIDNSDNIVKFLTANLNYLDKQKMKDNNFLSSMYVYLKQYNKLPFPITEQINLFFKKNNKDINLIFKYFSFRYKFYLASVNKIELDHPPYLLIEPVSTCNLRCGFCFQTDKSFTKKPYMGVMNFELFKKVCDDADNIGVGAITIGSRGEPSLHKDIAKMISYLGTKRNIYEKKFITNATFLNEKLIESLLKNDINIIQISADHYLKKDYEELRLNSNFEKIVKNVDNLFLARKKKYPNSKSEIRVSGVDARKNLDREKFREFWIKRSDHVSAGMPVERWNTYENDLHPELNKPCELLWNRMYIWFDGKANPCDSDYKSYLSYGNANDDDIKEIWNSKKIQEIRRNHLNNKRSEINPCNKCGADFDN